MRWYLWNNSYGCTDATMNSYKRFMWRGEIFSRNWLPFSTPWNISSFFFLSFSVYKHFSLIRLRVSCNATFISFCEKATCFGTSPSGRGKSYGLVKKRIHSHRNIENCREVMHFWCSHIINKGLRFESIKTVLCDESFMQLFSYIMN